MEVFEAVAQPKRREILRLLSTGELSAGEIASRFAVTQPPISQHLKVLKDVGLVHERREGTKRLLSLRPEGLVELNAFLTEVLPAGLERLESAAEQEDRRSPGARAASPRSSAGRTSTASTQQATQR
jgi:DNA-binding transcriptional ArsR family regulator